MSSLQYLLLLSSVGCVLLWGTMLVNGTLDGVTRATQLGKFPDGRALRKTYTGYHAIDDNIVVVIAFFDLLTASRTSEAPRWLFYDLCNVLGAINTWVLVESRRRGVRNFFLRHIVIFIFLWNMSGAAMVTPIYFYMLAKSGHTTRDATIPLNEARGIPPTLVANALFPLLMYVPAWRGWSADVHQGLIGWYNLTPMLMIVVVVACSRPGTTLTEIATPKKAAAPNEDAPWIVASYMATGILSAVVHLYIVAAAIFTGSAAASDLSFARLYLPSPTNVFRAPQGSIDALIEGAHLFTQYDLLVLAVACVVFTHYMLQKASGASSTKDKAKELYWNAIGTAIVGPAAAGSFALAAREYRLRRTSQAVKQIS